MVLGDPGAGKSTLLRWLATAYLLKLEQSADFALLPDAESLPGDNWLPILVRCRELAKSSVGDCALDDLLRQTLPKLELSQADVGVLLQFLRLRLESGNAILLFDGLDEITDPNLRIKFCERIETIAKSYPRTPVIATARIVGYREMRRRLGVGFVHATLADLIPSEKDDFVKRWCAVTIADPSRRAIESQNLSEGIHASDRIERLTTNPMLLTTMALVQRKNWKTATASTQTILGGCRFVITLASIT
jgi:predicted NACHT family NTPase